MIVGDERERALRRVAAGFGGLTIVSEVAALLAIL